MTKPDGAVELDWGRSFWVAAEQVPVWAYIALIALGILAVLPLASEFGQSWDVAFCETRGRAAYEFYFNGFDGRKFNEALVPNGRYYGPAFDVLVTAAQKFMARDAIEAFKVRSILQALAALSCLIPVFLISSRLVSRPSAMISVLLVAATPVFFGHAFINPKDALFTSAFVWSLYLILHCYGDGKARSYVCAGVLGLVLGYAVSLRYIAVYLLVLIPISAILLPALLDARRTLSESLIAALRENGANIVFFSIVCAAAYLISMPAILADPSLETMQTIVGMFARYPWGSEVLYFGEYIPATALPWHYTFGYMIVQLPLYYHFFLIAVIAAAIVMPAKIASALRSFLARDMSASSTVLALIVAVFVPLVLIVISRPVLYDAFRQTLFVVPPLCIFLYAAFVGVIHQVPGLLQAGLGLVAALLWLQAVAALVRLHPYEYAYYNPLVRPSGMFELDYWGTSFKEIAEKLNRLPPDPEGRKLRVAVCGPRHLLAPFLDPAKFEFVPDTQDPPIVGYQISKGRPDIQVALNRLNCLDSLQRHRPWLFTVKREGAILAAAARVERSNKR